MTRQLYILVLFVAYALGLSAQDHVRGTVSADTPYTDLVQCPVDDQGLDLNVRVTFDEESNRVTVSVTSPRQLFAFYDRYRHRDVFKNWWGKRKLRLNRLPASPLVEHRSDYRIKGAVVKKYKKPRRNHAYLPWLVTSCKSELTPSATLLPDSLVETFVVEADQGEVEFTLRNILVVEHSNGLPANTPMPLEQSKRRKHFRFIAERDLQRTYHITLRRNPCWGQTEAIAAAQQSLDELRGEWKKLLDTFNPETPISPAAHDILNKSKAYVALRYRAYSDSSACASLNNIYMAYNTLLDSVSKLDCPVIDPTAADGNKEGLVGVSPESVLMQAHRIDSNVGRYLISSSPQERSDLARECRKVIADTQDLIKTNGVINEEQRKAVAVFNKSVSYFRKICKY